MQIDLDALLADVRAALTDWRRLAYNASQIGDAAGFGRCDREIERLERTEDDLRARIARR